MNIIKKELIIFIFNTSDIKISELNISLEKYAEMYLGKDRFDRLTDLHIKITFDRHLDTDLLEISEQALDDLIFLYFEGNIDDKSIEHVELDFLIKGFLE